MLRKTRGEGSIGDVNSESISEQQIAVRAFERWMGRGAPASDGVEDWLAARCELEAELGTSPRVRRSATKAKSPRPRKSVH